MHFDTIADGLWFPEGPVALADGSIMLVEIRRGTLTRVKSDGTHEIIAEFDGAPNGAAIGPDGAVYVTNNGGFNWMEQSDGSFVPHGMPPSYITGAIDRVDLTTGRVSRLYASCDGRRLRGPNDLVFDHQGGFWFTDPGKFTEETIDWGHLYYAQIDGAMIKRVGVSMISPNGIGLSPDGKTLFVAETITSRLFAFEVDAPGQLSATPPQVLGPLAGYQMLDSLAVESDGCVCVGTLFNGGITRFSMNGQVQHIAVPDTMVTNLCFGGADMCTVWITASQTGRLLRGRWPRPGLRLNYNA